MRKHERILSEVSAYFDIDEKSITGPSQLKHIVQARHVAMYLMRKAGMTLLETAQRTGRMDHTTVLNAIQRLDPLIKSGQEPGKAIREIEERLRSCPAS